MGYDYLLIKWPPDLARSAPGEVNREAVLMSFADAFSGEAIGALDAVKSSLQKFFPSLHWRQQKFEIAPHLLFAELGDWSWSTASQPDMPEFSLGADAHGQVRTISAARVERGQLDRIATTLGLLVLDERALEFLTG